MGNGYGNRQWGDKPKQDPTTITTFTAPFQPTANFDVPNGVVVRLGEFRPTKMTDDNGNTVLELKLQWANTESLVKDRWGIKPVKLTKTLLKDLFQIVRQLDEKAAWNALNEPMNLTEWKAEFEGRVVTLYAEERQLPDKREEQRTGQKVTKAVKMLRARPAAGYDVPQTAPQQTPQTNGVIEPQKPVEPAKPLSAREYFQQMEADEFWHLLAVKYAPKGDALTDRDFILAKVKLAAVVKKIEEAIAANKTINDLKPDVNPFLEPWSLEDAAQVLEVQVTDLYPLPLKDVRDNLSAIFAAA